MKGLRLGIIIVVIIAVVLIQWRLMQNRTDFHQHWMSPARTQGNFWAHRHLECLSLIGLSAW